MSLIIGCVMCHIIKNVSEDVFFVLFTGLITLSNGISRQECQEWGGFLFFRTIAMQHRCSGQPSVHSEKRMVAELNIGGRIEVWQIH